MNSHDQFAENFIRHQRRVYTYITTLLPNRDHAEEAFQQTSLVLWKKWDQFDASRSFVPWACGIALNEVRNYLRKNRRRYVVFSEETMGELAAAQAEIEPAGESRLSALSHCVGQLDRRQRDLVEAYYSGTTTTKRLAEKLGLAPSALYMRLHRIRMALAECVKRSLGEAGRLPGSASGNPRESGLLPGQATGTAGPPA